MTIGFSSGCIHKLMHQGNYNKDQWITLWRDMSNYIDFNAFEILIKPEDEKTFKLSPENYEWLASLDHLSYHLCQCTDDTIRVLEQLPPLSSIVCHVGEMYMLTWLFWQLYGHKVIFENVEGKDLPFLPSDEICFDINHGIPLGLEWIDKFYIRNSYRIAEIHMSNYDPILKHVPFYNREHVFTNFNLFKRFPIIIESVFDSAQEIEKELQFLKRVVYNNEPI